ncbi:MAG: calcium-binding protein [Nostoc sp. S4]|nr:calcium-binding protein [Nostoc sp. S4]
MANIIGTNGNDTLQGTESADTINGKAGNDTITGLPGNDTLTGGGGKDIFVYDYFFNDFDTITDFGGIGKGTSPTPAVIAEVDTIKFNGSSLFTAQDLLLTQNGNNLEITFRYTEDAQVTLKNFKLEDLENLKASGTRPAIGNILFYGETSITDSFNVLDANSTDTTIGIKNTVTFLNDLDNNITGLDNSNDVINGQGGNDTIDGKSGDDLLRGGTGNNTLIGGVGNDTLDAYSSDAYSSSGNNILSGDTGDDTLIIDDTLIFDYSNAGNNRALGGDGNDFIYAYRAKGRNTLIGGAGNDTLNADFSNGNNTLNGDAGNDILSAYLSSNNTLNGGAGNDFLSVSASNFGNLLSGDDGNDYLSASTSLDSYSPIFFGSNTLNGGVGDDTLDTSDSTNNNILNGGDGNDFLSAFEYNDSKNGTLFGNHTLNGGNGNDSFSIVLYPSPSPSATQTVDGGTGKDLLNIEFNKPDGAITASFNTATNTGSIKVDTNLINYKNIEGLVITLFSDPNKNNDLIVGSSGNDTLDINVSGNDTIDGGTGDDLLIASRYALTQGSGISSTFNATTNTGSITAGTNRLNYKNIERLDILGTAYNDNIVGSNGNDTLSTGNGGKDTIDGGKGDDLLSVNYSNAAAGITSTFNATNNTGSITAGTYQVSYKNIERLNISGTAYNDNIVGSNGNDTLSVGNGGKDTIDGGKGDDVLSADYSNASGGITSTFNATNNTGSITAGTYQVSYKNIERLNISGTAYNDNIVGSNGNDTLSVGNGGKDTIDGGKGDDVLSADYSNASGGITSTFNATNNTGSITAGTYRVSYKNIERLNISGTAYNDNIVGNNGNDTLSVGTGGNDTLVGGGGNDSLSADFSSGNNNLNGGSGNDSLSADFSSGNNTLNGGTGNDSLTAFLSEGNNLLFGDDGNDILTGGGNDSLYGGAGTDTFVFNSFNQGSDRIFDFNATNEVIQVSFYNFGDDLSLGVLKASQFTIGTSATTGAQRFIYNSTTGALFFDSDGSAGEFTQVQFAQLTAGLSLTNNNFVVVEA